KTIEVGVFTGYSLLSIALALPDDAKMVAIDPNREAYETGLPYLGKAGVAHKIQFIESDAMNILKDFRANGEEESFDFAFVDADKENYINYHEELLKLVKIVALSEDKVDKETLERTGANRVHLKDLNTFLAADSRIELAHLSIGDGLTLCRRLK
ncbi:flavonoid 3, 5 -methyltransferase-like, partial [Olea europaea subsp. europaea]